MSQPARLRASLFGGNRAAGFGLLQDLHDLALLVEESVVTWTVIAETASALRDEQLASGADAALEDLKRQRTWLHSSLKRLASQVLTVPV